MLSAWTRARTDGDWMNGADILCDTLLAAGVDTCFANPGTSEMHFVAALDRRPAMRCVLGLFEGVVTGAADGYGRMAGRPAATLLHTGPGLANGLANLHNAKRAGAPIVNIVGDHASYHLPFDAPLTTDIEALAAPMSHWVHRVRGPDEVGSATETAVATARRLPGIATLILPGDAAWGEAQGSHPSPGPAARPAVSVESVRTAAEALRSAPGRCALVLGSAAAQGAALTAAARIADCVDGRLFGGMFVPRAERGQGRPLVERIPYPVDQAVAALADIDVLILVGAAAPVAFFAYPGKPSALTQPDARILDLTGSGEEAGKALERLADELGARPTSKASRLALPENAPAQGALSNEALCHLIGAGIPEGAIVVDEALTSVRGLYDATAGAPPHDYLMACTGGAIGAGLPVATGAAIACPDRKVLALQADGSGMYTLQALWTMAREHLDVLTFVFANRAYAILQAEMRAVGVNRFGRNAERMLSLDHPALDWVAMAAGLGVEGVRVETCEGFDDVYRSALKRHGPFLIEAVM